MWRLVWQALFVRPEAVVETPCEHPAVVDAGGRVDGHGSPRHQTHFELSFLEFDGIL
jgi:hypothetical protein